MAKIISLFNHKGGVSKTTTTFHLGWKLAQLGQKVLIVDADPQCNLTGLTLGIEDYDSLFKFYDSRQNNNIYTALAPTFGLSSGQIGYIEGIDTNATRHKNLFLMAGHIDFSKIDIQIATALTSAGSLPILKTFISAIYSLLEKTAKKSDFDIVLIDMSPSVSATNMCLLMGSDYFIIPTSPDFFCFQAINSLASVLPSWSKQMMPFKSNGTLNKNNPKLLGIISQNYRAYGKESDEDQKKMAKSFDKWSQKINEATNNVLVPSLQENSMVIDQDLFKKYVQYDIPFNLASIQNFNSLIPVSQSHLKPMYELKQEDYKGWNGSIWEREQNGKKVGAKINIEECNIIYDQFSKSVLNLINA